jgi:hypothetical protein
VEPNRNVRNVRRRRWSVVVIGAAVLVAAACGTRAPKAPLAHVCQFCKCVCADEQALFWQLAETRPIVWLANGDASCPDGFRLGLAGDGP